MATSETMNRVEGPAEAVRCAHCGEPLALDQRYCLGCGSRGPTAAPPLEALAPLDHGTAPPDGPERPLTGGQAAFGAAVIVLVLGIGVVIGKAAGGDSGAQQAKAPVIHVDGGATARNASTGGSFTSDWPDGKNGYTVQLQTLAKDGTDPAAVAAAKRDASAKGAKDVGALDTDDFDSLKAGNYVIYSGIYSSKGAAMKALKPLKAKFAGARVIKVSSGGGGGGDALSGGKKEGTVNRQQLKQLQNLSPEEYSKRSRKLPDTTKIPGKPPPKDHKKPGGGSNAEVIQ